MDEVFNIYDIVSDKLDHLTDNEMLTIMDSLKKLYELGLKYTSREVAPFVEEWGENNSPGAAWIEDEDEEEEIIPDQFEGELDEPILPHWFIFDEDKMIAMGEELIELYASVLSISHAYPALEYVYDILNRNYVYIDFELDEEALLNKKEIEEGNMYFIEFALAISETYYSPQEENGEIVDKELYCTYRMCMISVAMTNINNLLKSENLTQFIEREIELLLGSYSLMMKGEDVSKLRKYLHFLLNRQL